MRVLVTGSRDWTDWRAVDAALETLAEMCDWQVTVVHGACPTGADYVAGRWARDNVLREGVSEEPHPADWETHGKKAGPIRNREMAALGADVCLAFILNGSRGATGCAAEAEAVGIPTVRYTATYAHLGHLRRAARAAEASA